MANNVWITATIVITFSRPTQGYSASIFVSIWLTENTVCRAVQYRKCNRADTARPVAILAIWTIRMYAVYNVPAGFTTRLQIFASLLMSTAASTSILQVKRPVWANAPQPTSLQTARGAWCSVPATHLYTMHACNSAHWRIITTCRCVPPIATALMGRSPISWYALPCVQQICNTQALVNAWVSASQRYLMARTINASTLPRTACWLITTRWQASQSVY